MDKIKIALRKIILFWIFIFLNLCWMQPQKDVSMPLDSTQVPLGGSIQLHFKFEHLDKNQTLILPDYTLFNNEKYEFVDQELDSIILENGQKTYTEKIRFIALEQGKIEIPSFTFFIGKDSVLSDPKTLEVVPVPIEDLQKIADIADIEKVDLIWKDRLLQIWQWFEKNPWFFFVLLLIILSLITYFGVKKYLALQEKKQKMPEKIILPPALEALEKLQVLEQAKIWQKGDYKLYYTELSFILRHYLQRKYLIPALEETTAKILTHLKRTPFALDQKENLRALLALSDLVKFAKQEPQAQDNESALRNMRLFIEAELAQENVQDLNSKTEKE